MRTSLLLFLLAALLIAPVSPVQANARLAGRILLQVEENGEAWYVNPLTHERHYLRNGAIALQLLRAEGLGITNADISQIPVGLLDPVGTDTDGDGLEDGLEEAIGTSTMNTDTDGDGFADALEVENGYNPLGAGRVTTSDALVNRLAGRILLQVDSHGEAWYVNPADGRRYYMNSGDAAFEVMRSLGLGITNADLNQIGATNNGTDCGTDYDCVIVALLQGHGVTFEIDGDYEHAGATTHTRSMAEFFAPDQDGVIRLEMTRTATTISWDQGLIDHHRGLGRDDGDITFMLNDANFNAKIQNGDMRTCTSSDRQAYIDVLQNWRAGTFSSQEFSFATCWYDQAEMAPRSLAKFLQLSTIYLNQGETFSGANLGISYGDEGFDGVVIYRFAKEGVPQHHLIPRVGRIENISFEERTPPEWHMDLSNTAFTFREDGWQQTDTFEEPGAYGLGVQVVTCEHIERAFEKACADVTAEDLMSVPSIPGSTTKFQAFFVAGPDETPEEMQWRYHELYPPGVPHWLFDSL